MVDYPGLYLADTGLLRDLCRQAQAQAELLERREIVIHYQGDIHVAQRCGITDSHRAIDIRHAHRPILQDAPNA